MYILNQEIPGIYSFDMFKPEFCSKIMEEAENFEQWSLSNGVNVQRPNCKINNITLN